MKRRITIISAAVLCLSACVNKELTTIGKANAAEASAIEATATADYELVAPFPDRPGIYKVYDLESGLVCHISVGPEGSYSHNTVSSISCNPDTRPDSHFPGTRP